MSDSSAVPQTKSLRPPVAKPLANTGDQKSPQRLADQKSRQSSDDQNMDSSRKIHALFKDDLNPWQEELWIIALNNELQLITKTMLFRGTAESCPLHPRDVFRVLILANASCFALAHNHPSGNASPSKQDQEITHRMSELGHMMEIPLIDHLVVCEKVYYSFADAGNLSGKIRRSLGKRTVRRGV